MSDTGNHAGKPPKYDEKGGRSFKIWVTKQKANALIRKRATSGESRCVLAFETAEMMNKTTEEQDYCKYWPGGKFSRISERIHLNEKPDDDMAKFELNEELRTRPLISNSDSHVRIRKEWPSFFVPKRKGLCPSNDRYEHNHKDR